MIFHRILGLLLVLLSGTMMVCFSEQLFFPLLLMLLALVGVSGRFQFRLSRERRIILYLVLALFFQAVRRVSAYFHFGVSGFFFYTFFYFIGLYFLTLETLEFFFFPRRLPATLVIFGTLVMCSAGNIYATERQDFLYQAFALSFVTLAALFFATSSREALRSPFSNSRSFWRTLTLVFILLTSFLTGQQIRKYREVISRAFIERLARMETFGPGFSATARLGSVMDLRYRLREASPVLRVYSQRRPGYLRGRAYEEYRRSEWGSVASRRDLSALTGVRTPAGRNFFAIRKTAGKNLLTFDIWPAPQVEEGMFAPLYTVYVLAPVNVLEVDDHSIFDAGELIGGFNYTDYVSPEPLPENLTPEQRQRLLSVPESLDPAVRELARDIFQGTRTVKEKVAAVERYFHTHYRYHPGISVPLGEDPLNYFLLKRPAAHCEYFASGATVLLRLAGVPSRYVVGFLVEERNQLGGYWVARTKDAHAWAEALSEENYWLTVEATPPEGLPRERTVNQAVVLLESISFYLQRVQVFLRAEFVFWMKSFREHLKVSGQKISSVIANRSVAGLASMLLLVVIFRLLWKRRKPDVHRHLQHLLRKVERSLLWRQQRRHHAETLHQFAARLRGVSLRGYDSQRIAEWLEAYARVRYKGEIKLESLQQLTQQLRTTRTSWWKPTK
ncbi:MAG TPA: transglutaminase domain-containing protein [bacterium]|nr:transglutaminase domain-containing protein [bacterium]